MTRLSKSVTRATNRFIRGDEIVIELQNGFLVARLKGKPSSKHTIDYQGLYERLAWDDAAERLGGRKKR